MSIYSITATDICPACMSQTEYDRCLANNGGDTAATLASVVTQAEGDLHARSGGAPAGATLQVLFRPMVIACVLYWLHARRAQQDNAKIPPTVQAGYDAALAWAADRGRNLLDAESVSLSTDGIAVTSNQDPVFTRDNLDAF